ncbi:hypothetical protein ACFYT4_36110 [Streptomyces sp. NPDC004609]
MPELVRALKLRGRALRAVEYFTGNTEFSLDRCPETVDAFVISGEK